LLYPTPVFAPFYFFLVVPTIRPGNVGPGGEEEKTGRKEQRAKMKYQS